MDRIENLDEGDQVIAKSRPPSQRPERKQDETSKAIALALEEAKATKAQESDKSDDNTAKRPLMSRGVASNADLRKTKGPVTSPSTKRPKHPGG